MSEPDGFLVRLGSLESFANTVEAVRSDYNLLGDQLSNADLSVKNPSFGGLLGQPVLPGSKAVDDACRNVLTAYSSLFSRVAWAQKVLTANLDTIAANIAETHQLYRDVESTHENLFRGMLETFESGGEPVAGGEDGSAGQR